VSGHYADNTPFANLPLSSLPHDAVPVTLNVAETQPLFFSSLGVFSATSGGQLFAQSTSPTITLGTLSATLVNLTSPGGSIVGAPGTATRITSTGDVYLSAQGNVAQAVDAGSGAITPLKVQIGGTLVSATAGGAIGILQVNGNLTFDTGSIVSTGGNVRIEVPNGSPVQNLNGCDPSAGACTAITANGIQIVSGVVVGSANQRMGLKLGTGDLSVSAPSGIYLTIDGSANVESLNDRGGGQRGRDRRRPEPGEDHLVGPGQHLHPGRRVCPGRR
jgi:hypothetical protein